MLARIAKRTGLTPEDLRPTRAIGTPVVMPRNSRATTLTVGPFHCSRRTRFIRGGVLQAIGYRHRRRRLLCARRNRCRAPLRSAMSRSSPLVASTRLRQPQSISPPTPKTSRGPSPSTLRGRRTNTAAAQPAGCVGRNRRGAFRPTHTRTDAIGSSRNPRGATGLPAGGSSACRHKNP
jgi:hypothetical protein